jgi:thiamine-monophosphate kinase
VTGEFEALSRLTGRFSAPPAGEVWAGDDGAVLEGGLVVATDPMVEGVHFLRSLTTLADAGWKALARNVSDVAAMGAVPWRCVVSVVGASEEDLVALYDGLLEAASHWSCPVVGGDLASGPGLVVTVTLLGRLPEGAAPLLRSGARAGDGLYVSRPLGLGAAGLRHLRDDPEAMGGWRRPRPPDGTAPGLSRAARWYARPGPDVAFALDVRAAGATAAIDVSDGLAQDLDHIARASGVGFRLDRVPVHEEATLEEALHGGDDYQLAFSCPDPGDGDVVPGIRIGTCTEDPDERTIEGRPLAVTGWEHPMAGDPPTEPVPPSSRPL